MNITRTEPREEIRNFLEELISFGAPIGRMTISDSETDFGCSSYLMIDQGRLKVRVSDHSVTKSTRITQEMHLSPKSKNEIKNRIEYYFFPERFHVVESMVFGDAHERGLHTLKNLSEEYRIVDDYNHKKVSKKGNVMVKIQRKNVIQKKLVRISK